jgi:putative DNA primase/helicase
MTQLSQAIEQMLDAGMPAFPDGHPYVDGKIHRYGRERRGFYVLHEWLSPKGLQYVSGTFGFFGYVDQQNIEANAPGLSPELQAAFKRKIAADQERNRRKAEDAAHRAANRANQQWKSAESVPVESPYLVRKQVQAQRVRAFSDGTVLVPGYQYNDEGFLRIVGLQKITADGTKRFNKGMAKASSFCPIGAVLKAPAVILFCEGYATGLSITQALNDDLPVLVCFDAYNLCAVAEVVRKQYPDAHFLFCSDDDRFNDEKVGNTGMKYAHRAADASGAANGAASVVRPLFIMSEHKGTDFNDLHCYEGMKFVVEQLREALDFGKNARASAAAKDAAESNVVPLRPVDQQTNNIATPEPAEGDKASAEVHWEIDLARTEKGAIKPTVSNIAIILAKSPKWEGVIARNKFTESVMKLRAPPYEGGAAGEWRDMDDICTRMWLERTYGFTARKDDIVDAVLERAERSSFHPVHDYFSGLVWDGKERLPELFPAYFGSRDLPYLRLVSQKFMVSAVARVFKPGCKVDSVLILEGRQGLKKSSAVRALADPWFTDTPLKFNDKETYLLLQGQLVIELAELDSFSRAESSAAKLFFSMTESFYRPWYARRPVRVPRQCVFVGTVNNDNYLKDDTGNRRYWPVKCEFICLDEIKRDRDQLWAEAVHLYNQGFKWYVEEHDRHLFEEEQSQRYVEDAYTSLIRDWVVKDETKLLVDGPAFKGFETSDILRDAIKLDVGRWTRAEQQRIGHCLRELGFVRKRSSKFGRPWVYHPPNLNSNGSDPQKEANADEKYLPV